MHEKSIFKYHKTDMITTQAYAAINMSQMNEQKLNNRKWTLLDEDLPPAIDKLCQ